MKKNFLIGLLKYGLGIALFVGVIWWNWEPQGNSPGLSGILQQPIHVLPLVTAGLLCLASVLLTFCRWYMLVRAQDLPFTLFNAMRLGLIGFSLSTLFPGSIGGDIVKAYFIAREQGRRTVAIATVIVDRVIGLWGLFWLVALLGGVFWLAGDAALMNKPVLQNAVLIALGLVGFTMVIWVGLRLVPDTLAERLTQLLTRIPKLGGPAAEFWRAIWMYRCQGRWVFASLLLSLVSHTGFVLTFYFAAHTFQTGNAADIPSLSEHFLLVPVGMTFQALFPSPGGLGGTEFAFGELYWVVLGTAAARSCGIAAALAYRLITITLALLGYLVYLRMRREVIVAPGDLPEKEVTVPLEENAGLATPGLGSDR